MKRNEHHPLPKWFTPTIFAVFVIFAALLHYGPGIIAEILR